MQCPKCGAVNDDMNSLCGSCGAAMTSGPSSPDGPASQPSLIGQARPPRRLGKNKKIAIATVFVVATILIATVMAEAYVNRSAVPNAPTGLIANAGDEQVTLSWTAPSNDGGAAVTSYYVYEDNGTAPVDAATLTVPSPLQV